jgi:hypothetical protein
MATAITAQASQCECSASHAGLLPIPVGGPLMKFQVCPKCGTVWVERYRTPGGQPDSVLDFNMEDARVPGAVRDQARALVGTIPRYLRDRSVVYLH